MAENIETKWKGKMALFFVGQMVTLVGSMLVQYAIVWYIAQQYQSGLMVTVSAVCGFLPQVVISFWAGVWADRWSRKALMILSDLGIALVTLGIAACFFFGFQPVWLLFAVLAIRSLGQGIQTPAVNAFITDIVPKDKLMKINGLMGAMQGMMSVVPIALGGLMYAFLDLYIIFFVDVVTAIIGVSLLAFVKVKKSSDERKGNAEKVGYFTDFKAGVKFIFSNKFLKIFVLSYAICNIIITPVAFLTPLQTTRSFGNDAWRLPAIELAFTLGMIIMGVVVGFWQGFKSRTKTMGAAFICQGFMIAALGVVPLILPMTEVGFALYLTAMLIGGCILPYINTPAVTVLQETTAPQMMGRVFGFVQIASALALPIGMAIFGPIADVIAIEWLLIFTGVAMLLYSIWHLKNKTIQNYKDYAHKKEPTSSPAGSEGEAESVQSTQENEKII